MIEPKLFIWKVIMMIPCKVGIFSVDQKTKMVPTAVFLIGPYGKMHKCFFLETTKILTIIRWAIQALWTSGSYFCWSALLISCHVHLYNIHFVRVNYKELQDFAQKNKTITFDNFIISLTFFGLFLFDNFMKHS